MNDQMKVSQKDPWILHRMRDLFGGSVLEVNPEYFTWLACGPRARGFAMSIYGLLSPRRQAQIRAKVHFR